MSLLKQAIVDAASLKEAALKNAEQLILEKYSNEVKTAIDTLLEQEEAEATTATEAETTTFEEENLVTPSYMEGEAITSQNGEFDLETPDEGETIDINISPEELAQFLRDAEQNEVGQYIDPKLDDLQVDDDEEVEIDLSALADIETDEADETDETEEIADEETIATTPEEEIEINDTEELERMVAEALNVDYKPQPHGDVGGGKEVDYEAAIDMALAKAMTDEALEEAEELQSTIAELEEQVQSLQEENKRFRTVTLQLKDKLEESIVTNAKLLYSNRVLISASLNERQKQRIVEALTNAQTVEEAKTIYETLQSTVNGNKSNPQTLGEAINRQAGRSSTLPRRTPEKENLNESALQRMKKLAGIK